MNRRRMRISGCIAVTLVLVIFFPFALVGTLLHAALTLTLAAVNQILDLWGIK